MDGTKIAIGLATVGIGSMGLFLAVGVLAFPGELVIDEVVEAQVEADEVWQDVASLRRWARWSPWRAERDETLAVEYAGPSEGFGARMTWSSEESGAGTLRVTGVDEMRQTWEIVLAGGALAFEEAIQVESVAAGVRVRWTSKAELGLNPFNRYYAAWIAGGLAAERREALELLVSQPTGEG